MSERKKILIVDDDPMIRAVLSTMLKKEGYDTVEAAEGNEGLRKVLEAAPALVLSDRVMPEGMSGFEFLKRLRELPSDVPFVFLTALIDPRDKSAVCDYNVTDYLDKPVTPDALHACLKKIFPE
jgi:CheY-like chemotaxis protein